MVEMKQRQSAICQSSKNTHQKGLVVVGEKKTESVVNCIHCMQYMKKENTEMSFGVCCFH